MNSYARTLFILILLVFSALSTPNAYAVHSVSATPPGGTYNSAQSITLTATENSTINYTTDGTEPTNSSAIYTSPIEITANTTLKFFATALSDNHTTSVVTESYTIDAFAPVVIATDPADGQKGVDAATVINVTFSESMDDSTINSDTFIVENREHLQYFGVVSYDLASNTATFFPDFLDEANHYIVTLKTDIKDLAGNSLGEDYVFTFATGPDLGIRLFQHNPSDFHLLGGGTFTITPDPFTLSGSLTVEDNVFPDTDPNDGSIFLNNIEFGTYIVSQTGVPAGFGNIFDNVTITAHDTFLLPNAEFRNRDLSIPITDFPPPIFSRVPPPDLTSDQFDLYKDSVQVGVFLGFEGGLSGPRTVTAVGPSQIPGGTLETQVTLNHPETTLESVLFDISASPGTTAQDLFASFRIPRYPDIDPGITSDTFYFVPAFIIPYGNTGNNFMLTPTIGHVRPGMTLVLEQPSYIESVEAKVERVNMTFNAVGNNVGFSFAITDVRPPGTPEPPLDVPALFLDVDFVGNIDFSNPSAFESSPIIDILVNKTLPGFPQLPDGCTDFQLLLFNEGTGKWEVISQLRSPTKDTDTQCGFTLRPEHFSKFAVGGVKGQTISTENPPNRSEGGGGGGGLRSTGITSLPSGIDVEATVTTVSGPVSLRFESVEAGSGQLKVESSDLSAFEAIFTEIATMAQDNDEHGIIRLDGTTYFTAGNIFNIDASSINFQGMVDVTIAYNENTAALFSGSELGVRFLHYNDELGIWEDATSSVNDITNTVSGRVDSLSPVIAGIIMSENGMTLEIETPSITVSGETGEVTISSTIKNMQRMNQEYLAVVQIVDENNVAYYIDWEKGSAASAQDSSMSIKWKPTVNGSYR
ncbi:MAG: chitobiase/beta-hexosaminidase C-terminal domain-containing protein, partial [Nitrososphaera sp.]